MIYHCSRKINTIRTMTQLLHININSLKIKGCIDANKSSELISGLELFHGMITIREEIARTNKLFLEQKDPLDVIIMAIKFDGPMN